ncbi:CotH kinase family protein [Lactiplantibacillus plantarum]|uniref:CotH kinase family protein n=1 Tax=Lactiplantibacillus plantarum TaxID=1590 RepID=UPI0026515769|nr:CotH kinase family protein [Lactiplantibacillus plantarum]MDN7038144.1 hypothetical protein [Lactiplantibacillus plantarum]
MEKLKTNEISLGLDQTFRNDLVDNFKKIQDGVDGQSDAINKQITEAIAEYARDQKNYFPNGDLLIPNQTDPYLPLNGVDLAYVAPTASFSDDRSWVQVIGHDDDTPYKGVRVKLDLSTFPARYWRPTELSFILRNDDTGDSLFHVEMNIIKNNGDSIVKRVADFIASHDVNNKVKAIVPAPVLTGAKQGDIHAVWYNIWTENLRHVQFRITGITGKFQTNKINFETDQVLAKNNLLGTTDAKNGSIDPYVGLNAAESLVVQPNILSHNWVTASGTDNQTVGKGIGIDFTANTDDSFTLDKKFVGLVRTTSVSNLNYDVAITYNTSNGKVTKTIDTNLILGIGITKLEYTIPSPLSLGIDHASITTGRIQIYTSKPADFNLSATEWSLKNAIYNNGKTFTDDKALFVANNNFNGSAWSFYDLTKTLKVVNNKMTTYFAAVGTAKYRAAQLPLTINEDQKNNNIKANIELMNGDPASQQFMIRARYDYVTDAGILSVVAPITKSIAAPVNEWIKVKDILIPSAFSQGVPANVPTTIYLVVNVGNEADNSVAFWIGDTSLKMLPENNVSLMSAPLASSWTPKDMTKYPSAIGNIDGYQFQGNSDAATGRGARLNYGAHSDDVYSLPALLDFTFKPLVQKINKLSLTAEYSWNDASGTRQTLTHELLKDADVSTLQPNQFSNISILSAQSMGVPNDYTSNPIVSIVVNTNNPNDSDLKFFVGGVNLRLGTSKAVTDNETNNLTLPTVKLYGKFDTMTDKIHVTMRFQFSDHGRTITGYSDTKWQGDSSLRFPKKNLRLKLYKDETLATKLKIQPDSRFPKDNKFNLKANYIQTFSARNLVTSELFREVVSSRQSITPYVAGLNNYGAIVGFPVLLYINDNFYGLMTFNTTKDIITQPMSDTQPLAFAIQGESGSDANRFKASTATLTTGDDKLDFTLLGKDKVTPEIQNSVNNLLKFVNESSDEDFVAHIAEHYDVDSAIDWILMVDAAQLFDLLSKNVIHLTEDGTKFYAMLYDLDGSFANGWQGTDKFDPNNGYIPYPENKLFSRIIDNFKPKIKARYAELVSLGIFTTNNIQQLFKTFIESVGQTNYELDQNRWPDNPATKLFTYDETMDIVRKRMNVIKKDVNRL